MKKNYNFWVYIMTNPKKTVLYTGMTNNLPRRVQEHYESWERRDDNFTAKYFCYHLIWFEYHQYVNNAIAREKEIKSWVRAKKIALINKTNPNWEFLENRIKDWEF